MLGLQFNQRAAYGVLLALAMLVPTIGNAQQRSSISLIVGYPPGGSADLGARILADQLPGLLGQTVIVDNRSGAGGQIAARMVKAAPNDGSVFFFTNSHTVVTVPLILKVPGFDTVKDFRPVGQFSTFELAVVVHPSTKADNLNELRDYFNKTPGGRNIAVPAPGSVPEFIASRLSQLLKLDAQPVAYRGTAPAVQDLLGGQVTVAVLPIADVLQYVKVGKLKVIAVTHATSILPGAPGFTELGFPELAATDFLGVYAPAGTPEAIVQRMNNAMQKVLAMPDVKERILGYAMQPKPGSAKEFNSVFEKTEVIYKNLMLAVDYKPQ